MVASVDLRGRSQGISAELGGDLAPGASELLLTRLSKAERTGAGLKTMPIARCSCWLVVP
jgi:hypothetical protein